MDERHPVVTHRRRLYSTGDVDLGVTKEESVTVGPSTPPPAPAAPMIRYQSLTNFYSVGQRYEKMRL
jgi:hypothetical protein